MNCLGFCYVYWIIWLDRKEWYTWLFLESLIGICLYGNRSEFIVHCTYQGLRGGLGESRENPLPEKNRDSTGWYKTISRIPFKLLVYYAL